MLEARTLDMPADPGGLHCIRGWPDRWLCEEEVLDIALAKAHAAAGALAVPRFCRRGQRMEVSCQA